MSSNIVERSKLAIVYSTYYTHRHVVFDVDCRTIEEQQDCCTQSIVNGKTTADFEAEKYIIMYDYDMFLFVLHHFQDRLQDWTHLICSILINQNSVGYLSALLQAYHIVHLDYFLIEQANHDILFLYHLFTPDKMKKDFSFTLSIFCRFHPIVMDAETFLWERRNPQNARNLIYALWNNDADTALYLIENGCNVEVWNNFALSIIAKSPKLKANSKLTIALMNAGAKLVIKKISISKQFEDIMKLREQFRCQQIEQQQFSTDLQLSMKQQEIQKRISSTQKGIRQTMKDLIK